MKKIIRVLVVCALIAALFAGCSLPEKEFTYEDLTLTLPITFRDVFDEEEDMGDLEFYYANSKIAITGFGEDKDEIVDFYPDIDAKLYAQIVLDSMELDSELEQKDGLWTFSYESEVDGAMDTCVTVVYEVNEVFWLIQANCHNKDYKNLKDDIWKYLSTAKFAE